MCNTVRCRCEMKKLHFNFELLEPITFDQQRQEFSMPNLSTLSDDIRHEIVKQLAEPTNRSRYLYKKYSHISPFISLSSTCRSLNATCGIFIFRRYHLDLRRQKWRERKIYPPGSDSEQWDIGAINLRLAHLQSKALFVRELFITDEGELARGKGSGTHKPKAFPSEFMPELLATLRVLCNVTAIHLVTRPTTLINVDLWNWVVGVRPTTLSLRGCFVKPTNQDLVLIKHLETLSLHHCVLKTIDLFDVCALWFIRLKVLLNSVLQFQNIAKVSLTYGHGDEHVIFAPENGYLGHIDIVIDMWNRDFTYPFFDFSKVPQASISVKATFNVQLKGHIPVRVPCSM
jgi:hypothetical protein